MMKPYLKINFITLSVFLSTWALALPLPVKVPSIPTLPSLEKLEQAALRKAGLSPESIRAWERNSRRALALPRLQVGYEQNALIQNTSVIQDSVSVTSGGVVIGPESNRLDQDLNNDRGFEVKAVWALDELLFNRNQLDISREARDLYFVRTQLIQELHQSYFDLKAQALRLQLEPDLGNDPLEKLKTEQLVEKLNTLTGGEFKRLLAEFRNGEPE